MVAGHLQSWGGNDSTSPIDRGGNGITGVPGARGLLEEEEVAPGSQPERWVPAAGHPLLGGVELGSVRSDVSLRVLLPVFNPAMQSRVCPSPSPNTSLTQCGFSAFPPQAGAALPSLT